MPDWEDLLVFGDTQCGSVYGLWPKGYTMSDGAVYTLNTAQEYLWDAWLYQAYRIEQTQKSGDTRITGVVFMGDASEGRQKKRYGSEAVTTRQQDQIGAFLELMTVMLRGLPGVTVYGVQGTEAHDGTSADAFEGAMRALGAAQTSGLGLGRYSREVLDLDVHGVVINFAHHIPALTGLYRAVGVDRESLWSVIAGQEGKHPTAQVIVRAHVHNYVHIEHAGRHGVIVPAWQVQTRWERKSSVYRMTPDIGMVLIRVWKDRPWFDDRVQVYKYIYPLPPRRPHKHGATDADV